jgi:hypothetical protein
MEAQAEADMHASPTGQARTPESLRQRQRDRLSPRRGFAKTSRISSTARDLAGAAKNGVVLAPAPRSRGAGNTGSPDFTRKRQDGLRKENSVSQRAPREGEDSKFEIAPDGSSAGKGGRHFTVANVGNNGRIYLR